MILVTTNTKEAAMPLFLCLNINKSLQHLIIKTMNKYSYLLKKKESGELRR
jgi:hypothetical protein